MNVDLGFTLFLYESHYFYFKENMGRGTNNIRDLMTLFFMLKIYLGEGLRTLQFFRDSLFSLTG
jgi:hypothetical protein